MDKELLVTSHNLIFQTFLLESQKVTQELGLGWEEIKGCEFNIKTSINRLKQLIDVGHKSGYSRKSILKYWIHEVGEDLKGYTQEYILHTPLSPVEYEGEINDVQNFRLKSHNFTLTKEFKHDFNTIFEIRKMIDRDERNGAVYRGWVKLEEMAVKIAIGSIIILTSPDGKTGLKDTPDYPYSRTYILQITGDFWEQGKHYKKLKGCDLQSDLTLEEHRQLLNYFKPDQILPKSTAEKIAETPVIINAQNNQLTISDVIKVIQQIRVNNGHENIYKNRTFAEVYQSLNKQTLQFLDPKFEDEFYKFSQIVLTEESRVEIEIKQALALLIIQAYKLNQIPQPKADRPLDEKFYPDQKIDVTIYRSGNIIDGKNNSYIPYENTLYMQAYQQAQENRGSCGGGGNTQEFIDPVTKAINNALAKFNPAIPGIKGYANVDKYGSLEFECPHCKQKVTRSKGKLLKDCPKCNKDVSCK